MTSRCTLYLCTDGSPAAHSIENARSLSFSLSRHVRESRVTLFGVFAGLHPLNLRVMRWTSRCSLLRRIHPRNLRACRPSTLTHPPSKRVHFRLAVTRPEKSCPDWERAHFRDNDSSRESSDTHVSRANSRHVFVLNSDAVEEVSYVIELKAGKRVEQEWVSSLNYSLMILIIFFFMIFVSVCVRNSKIEKFCSIFASFWSYIYIN